MFVYNWMHCTRASYPESAKSQDGGFIMVNDEAGWSAPVWFPRAPRTRAERPEHMASLLSIHDKGGCINLQACSGGLPRTVRLEKKPLEVCIFLR